MTSPRPTRAEQREQARAKAQELRAREAKKKRTKKVLIQSSVAAGAVGVIAAVVLGVSSIEPASTAGPQNMASGGIVIGEDFTVERTGAFDSDANPTLTAQDSQTPLISIFIDYSCPACKGFEEYYGLFLRDIVTAGEAKIEYHPVAFRDPASGSYRYSTRSGNAAVCVADLDPDRFFDYTEILYVNQPDEINSLSLSDNELIDLAEQAGVQNMDDVSACIKNERFATWLEASTVRAMQTGPIPVQNATATIIPGTPTVFVNGVLYSGQTIEDLQAALEAARG